MYSFTVYLQLNMPELAPTVGFPVYLPHYPASPPIKLAAYGHRIRYLPKKDVNVYGCGHWFRYSVEMTQIDAVFGQIAERRSVSSAKRCEFSQLAYRMSVRTQTRARSVNTTPVRSIDSREHSNLEGITLRLGWLLEH